MKALGLFRCNQHVWAATVITAVWLLLAGAAQAASWIRIESPTQSSPVTKHPGESCTVTYSYSINGNPDWTAGNGGTIESG